MATMHQGRPTQAWLPKKLGIIHVKCSTASVVFFGCCVARACAHRHVLHICIAGHACLHRCCHACCTSWLCGSENARVSLHYVKTRRRSTWHRILGPRLNVKRSTGAWNAFDVTSGEKGITVSEGFQSRFQLGWCTLLSLKRRFFLAIPRGACTVLRS